MLFRNETAGDYKNMNPEETKDKKEEEDVPVFTIDPNENCPLCLGRGRVKVYTNKIPEQFKNVKFVGKVPRFAIKELCWKGGCVLSRGRKAAQAAGLGKDDKFKIELKEKKGDAKQ
jgi:hypothetical protein